MATQPTITTATTLNVIPTKGKYDSIEILDLRSYEIQKYSWAIM